jgi:hypothetical protein
MVWFSYYANLIRLPPSYNTVSTTAPQDILGPIFGYFADLDTGMGPYNSLKVCFTGIWTEIYEQVSSLVRSCIDPISSITYTGGVP